MDYVIFIAGMVLEFFAGYWCGSYELRRKKREKRR